MIVVAEAEPFDDVAPQRVPRLGAEPADALLGVVGVQRRQVHQRDGSKQPCRLVVALDRTPLGQAADAPLQRRAVDVAHRFQEAEVERHAGVAGDAVGAGALAAMRMATALAGATSAFRSATALLVISVLSFHADPGRG